jgi:L-arabinokinase
LKKAKEKGSGPRLPFGGFLANIGLNLFESRFSPVLPERMRGKDFLKSVGISIDSMTEVKRSKTYSVRDCTRHPVYENFRVSLFWKLMLSLGGRGENRRAGLIRMGDLMFQSHASYGACGLGEAVTDKLVAAVRQAGPEEGVYGAKITGGGSGGTVCVLAEGERGLKTVRRIAKKTLGKDKPFLTLGGSDGARRV